MIGFLALCALGLGQGKPVAVPLKILRVTLERTPCYGTCPAYTLTLNADGTAAYLGRLHVSRLGAYQGTFSNQALQRLVPLLDRWDFWKMKSRYESLATDLPSQTVTIETNRGKKSVYNYGMGSPASLRELHAWIDAVGESVRNWSKARSPRVV